MNRLFTHVDGLNLMESFDDACFEFVYIDPPYNAGNGFVFINNEINDHQSIRHYLAEKNNVKIGEISLEEVNNEKKRQEKLLNKRYNEYISKIIENAARVLVDDGVLALLVPGIEYSDIDYKLILEQFFPSTTHVVIERRKRPRSNNNTSTLFFCAKKQNYQFPILRELSPVEEYKDRDDFDYYRLTMLTNMLSDRAEYSFEWHGITPKRGSWRYSREKLDELFEGGRIIINNGKAFLKIYRSEHPVEISDVWEEDDYERSLLSLDSKSIDRMISLYVKRGSRVLCPYERDGKVSKHFDQAGTEWVSAYCPIDAREDCISTIPEEHYELVSELSTPMNRQYSSNIITGIDDIVEMKAELKKLSSAVAKIKEQFGVMNGDVDEIVETIISQIQEIIEQSVSKSSVESSVPEAKTWINPFWENLEPESRHFIPTGVLLYNQFKEDPDLDMAPILIEYCKTLERELFKKMFYGYIVNLIDRNVNIHSDFPEAFNNDSTRVFAVFLHECTKRNKNKSDRWKFEIGKMVFVLKQALGAPQDSIFIDFRKYLDDVFARQFFDSEFIQEMDEITKLRNNCAHPSVISNTVVDSGKELIRKKLLLILENYS